MARCNETVVTMERRQRRAGGKTVGFTRQHSCQERATVSYTVQGAVHRFCADHGEKRADWARRWALVEAAQA